MAQQLKLLIKAKRNLVDADFFLTDKGEPTDTNVGDFIGIKVTAIDKLDAKYLSYWFLNVFNNNVWKQNIGNRRLAPEDILNIEIEDR